MRVPQQLLFVLDAVLLVHVPRVVSAVEYLVSQVLVGIACDSLHAQGRAWPSMLKRGKTPHAQISLETTRMLILPADPLMQAPSLG